MNKKFNCCNPSKARSQSIVKLSSILKLVAEETRLKIFCILKDDEHCVCEIMEHIKESQSLVSHHLKDLKDAGIIIDKKRGLNVYYSLTKKGKTVTDLVFKIDEEVTDL